MREFTANDMLNPKTKNNAKKVFRKLNEAVMEIEAQHIKSPGLDNIIGKLYCNETDYYLVFNNPNYPAHEGKKITNGCFKITPTENTNVLNFSNEQASYNVSLNYLKMFFWKMSGAENNVVLFKEKPFSAIGKFALETLLNVVKPKSDLDIFNTIYNCYFFNELAKQKKSEMAFIIGSKIDFHDVTYEIKPVDYINENTLLSFHDFKKSLSFDLINLDDKTEKVSVVIQGKEYTADFKLIYSKNNVQQRSIDVKSFTEDSMCRLIAQDLELYNESQNTKFSPK